MPMTIGSSFGAASAYQQLQVERARNASARQQAASDVSGISDALSGASENLSQGLATLAAQAALTRLNAATSAKQAETQPADTGGVDADAIDPVTAVDAAINGITDLLPANVADAGNAADVVTSVNQIIDGAVTDDATGDTAVDGSDLFSTIDGIINSFVPPPPPVVDVVA